MSSTRAAPHDPDGIELNHSNCWSQELCCTGCQPNHASGWTGGQGLRWLGGGWASVPVSHSHRPFPARCRAPLSPPSTAWSPLPLSSPAFLQCTLDAGIILDDRLGCTLRPGPRSVPGPAPRRPPAPVCGRHCLEGGQGGSLCTSGERACPAACSVGPLGHHLPGPPGSPCQHMLALDGARNWPTLTPPTWSPCLPGAGQGAMPKHPVPETPWFQRGRASAVGRVCRRVRRGHSQTCGSIEAGGCDACGPGLMGWAEAGLCVCSSHLRVDGHRGLWPDCWSRGPGPRGLRHLNLQPAGSRGPLDPSSTTPFPPPHAAAPAARSAADVLGHVSPGLLPDPHAAIRRPRSGRAATGRRPRQVSHN